ncbi:hypothetical protein ACLB2K_009650 [Fragaria x ananassa]
MPEKCRLGCGSTRNIWSPDCFLQGKGGIWSCTETFLSLQLKQQLQIIMEHKEHTEAVTLLTSFATKVRNLDDKLLLVDGDLSV